MALCLKERERPFRLSLCVQECSALLFLKNYCLPGLRTDETKALALDGHSCDFYKPVTEIQLLGLQLQIQTGTAHPSSANVCSH